MLNIWPENLVGKNCYNFEDNVFFIRDCFYLSASYTHSCRRVACYSYGYRPSKADNSDRISAILTKLPSLALV